MTVVGSDSARILTELWNFYMIILKKNIHSQNNIIIRIEILYLILILNHYMLWSAKYSKALKTLPVC